MKSRNLIDVGAFQENLNFTLIESSFSALYSCIKFAYHVTQKVALNGDNVKTIPVRGRDFLLFIPTERGHDEL